MMHSMDPHGELCYGVLFFKIVYAFFVIFKYVKPACFVADMKERLDKE